MTMLEVMADNNFRLSTQNNIENKTEMYDDNIHYEVIRRFDSLEVLHGNLIIDNSYLVRNNYTLYIKKLKIIIGNLNIYGSYGTIIFIDLQIITGKIEIIGNIDIKFSNTCFNNFNKKYFR